MPLGYKGGQVSKYFCRIDICKPCGRRIESVYNSVIGTLITVGLYILYLRPVLQLVTASWNDHDTNTFRCDQVPGGARYGSDHDTHCW